MRRLRSFPVRSLCCTYIIPIYTYSNIHNIYRTASNKQKKKDRQELVFAVRRPKNKKKTSTLFASVNLVAKKHRRGHQLILLSYMSVSNCLLSVPPSIRCVVYYLLICFFFNVGFFFTSILPKNYSHMCVGE